MKVVRNMKKIKKEICVSLNNRFFLIPLFVLSTVSLLQCIEAVSMFHNYLTMISDKKETLNTGYPIYTSFNLWIGNSKSTYSTVFFIIAPLLASTPFSWSYVRDLKKGVFQYERDVRKNIVYRMVAVFVSSGLICVIPLIINFVLISVFVPSFVPDSIYDINYGIFSNNMMGIIFYRYPFAYILVYIIMSYGLNGSLGCLGLSISTISQSKTVAILFPSLLFWVVESLKNNLYVWTNREIITTSFFTANRPQFDNCFMITIELGLDILLTLLFFLIGLRGERMKDEESN